MVCLSNRWCLPAVLLLLLLTLPAGAQDVPTVAGVVDRVTVYRGQALVTRVVEVEGQPGLRELIVAPLPARVEPGSLHAESSDDLEVRSVRYRTRPVQQDVREEVRELDEQIQDARDEVDQLERRQELLKEAKAYIAQLETFTANTATTELKHGVLDADTLKSLSEYLLEQREQIAIRELETGRELREAREALELLNRQKAELTSTSTRTAREAVVLANVLRPGAVLRLSYLVNDATWSSSYIVRAADATPAEGDRRVELSYYASIQQTSGEDWDGVAMTLSTATPSLVASAPDLEALEIQLSQSSRMVSDLGLSEQQEALKSRAAELRRQRDVAVDDRQRTNLNFGAAQQAQQRNAPVAGVSGDRTRAQQEQDLTINRIAGQLQLLELSIDERDGQARPKNAAEQRDVTVTYELPQRTSLPSRRDQQMVRILSADLPAELVRVAVPVLTSHVYREASLANRSGQVLLAGPVASYREGQFVGHGSLPTVAAGETFRVGFGIDPSLRSRRELVERDEQIQGGNRVVTFQYQLAVDNFGDAPADVRLADRIPVAKNGQQVRITLAETTQDPAPTSERDKGLLRWDVTAPAGATAEQAATVGYTFRMEYDRQMDVTGMTVQ